VRGGGKKYYDLLGLDQGEAATSAQIRAAYKKAALKWHPDRNPGRKEEAERKFKQIAEAYETLADPDRKAFYDRWGDEGVSAHRDGGGAGAPGQGAGFPGGFGGAGRPTPPPPTHHAPPPPPPPKKKKNRKRRFFYKKKYIL